MCCWTHRTARILVTRAHYPVGPVSYSLLYTALIAMGDTKTCSSRAIEDQHGQLAETPPARGKQRGTSWDQPPTSSSRLCGPIFLLVTFLLVSPLIEEDSTQQQFTGFSVQPFLASTQPSSPPCSGHFRFSQLVLCKNVAAFFAKMTLKHQTRRKVPTPVALFSLILWTCVTHHAAVSSLYAAWPPGAG